MKLQFLAHQNEFRFGALNDCPWRILGPINMTFRFLDIFPYK